MGVRPRYGQPAAQLVCAAYIRFVSLGTLPNLEMVCNYCCEGVIQEEGVHVKIQDDDEDDDEDDERERRAQHRYSLRDRSRTQVQPYVPGLTDRPR